ncbi:hypothetical protein [Anaerobacillus alkaliphilus]|uniref:hypothetical protein n=1 Tax=Anaerobacillus alkaliphilus TaxID=1548597 RepID=UPI001375D4F4|nr:hypothetical protein [Anaerobacillus alkaliphilus]
MLLTLKEKKFLIQMLAKQKRSFWSSSKEKQLAEELLEKFEQNIRNEKTNDMKQSRL